MPSALSTAVPLEPLVTLDRLRSLFSTSVSLPTNCAAVYVSGVSSVASSVSATATGASFTPVTVISSSALALNAPSVIVYVNTSIAVAPAARPSTALAVVA